MGMVFGKISEEIPRHSLVYNATGFHVRKYEPSIAAVCKYDGSWGVGSDGSPFGKLARYIGVFSKPENSGSSSAPEAISMTAPVLIDSSKRDHSMMFLLPASKYSSIDQVPTPTNPNVGLRQVPERYLAVRGFNGNLRPARAHEQLDILLGDIAADGKWKPKSSAGDEEGKQQISASGKSGVEWMVAGYNAPFVIPYFKTNEILVTVEPQEDTRGA